MIGDVMVTDRQGLQLQVSVDVIPELAMSAYVALGGLEGQCTAIEAANNPIPGINEPVEVCVRPVNPVPTTSSTIAAAVTTPDGSGSAGGSKSKNSSGLVAGVVVAVLLAVAVVGLLAWQRRQHRIKVDTGATIRMEDNPLFTGIFIVYELK
jgi:hypothetical protein